MADGQSASTQNINLLYYMERIPEAYSMNCLILESNEIPTSITS